LNPNITLTFNYNHLSSLQTRPLLTGALEGDHCVNSLVEKRLKKEFDRKEMTRMVACAEACTRQLGKDRPKMSQVM